MKRMKKLLAMLLTVTMTCALSVTPALARDETSGGDSGTTSTEGSSGESETPTSTIGDGSTVIDKLEFVKIFVAPVDSAVTTQTFTFTMTPVTSAEIAASGATESYTVNPGEPGSGENGVLTATVTTNQGTTADKATTLSDYNTTGVKYTTSFNLNEIDFSDSATGIYRYTVVETTEGSEHMSVGNETYTVDLYVDQNHHVVWAKSVNANTKQKAPIVFKNTLHFTSVTIKKVVTGNMLTNADQETKEFTFKMQIPEGGDALTLSRGATFTYTKYDNTNTKISTGEITVAGDKGDADSTYLGSNQFTLKNGESIVFDNNIPVGMIFECREVADSDYTITYEYAAGSTPATGEGNPRSYFTSTAANNVLTFTNTKVDKVDSGIVLDIMPYIAVILIVAAAGVTTILAKRRRITK
jgi:hypothetical protein